MTNRLEFIVTKTKDGKFTTKYNRKTYSASTLRALDKALTKADVPDHRTFRVQP